MEQVESKNTGKPVKFHTTRYGFLLSQSKLNHVALSECDAYNILNL